jgi:hypothetical protein
VVGCRWDDEGNGTSLASRWRTVLLRILKTVMRVMTVMKIQSKTAGMVYKEKDAVTGAAKVPPNAYRGFFLPLSYRYSAFPWAVL